MILPPNEPRCQGRYVRVLGQATLANECSDCLRRTDELPPAPVFIKPAQRGWCLEKLDADYFGVTL